MLWAMQLAVVGMLQDLPSNVLAHAHGLQSARVLGRSLQCSYDAPLFAPRPSAHIHSNLYVDIAYMTNRTRQISWNRIQ